jgi:hypothetical protein
MLNLYPPPEMFDYIVDLLRDGTQLSRCRLGLLSTRKHLFVDIKFDNAEADAA